MDTTWHAPQRLRKTHAVVTSGLSMGKDFPPGHEHWLLPFTSGSYLQQLPPGGAAGWKPGGRRPPAAHPHRDHARAAVGCVCREQWATAGRQTKKRMRTPETTATGLVRAAARACARASEQIVRVSRSGSCRRTPAGVATSKLWDGTMTDGPTFGPGREQMVAVWHGLLRVKDCRAPRQSVLEVGLVMPE